MLYSGCLGRFDGWDALAVPEWSGRSGSVSRSRGGQTGGVFPWSFLFLASLRARAYSHPFGLATAGRRWRGSVPPGGQRLEAREDLPGEALRGKLSAAEGAAPAERPRRGSRGRPPPTVAGSASSGPGAARGPGSCLSPPSSTVGATLSSQGSGRGAGGARRPAVGDPPHGAATHLPKGAWRGGRLPRNRALRKRLRVGGLSESPQPPQAGFGLLVIGKPTVLPGSVSLFPQACENFVEHHALVGGSKAYL